jgi:hypothetical protein
MSNTVQNMMYSGASVNARANVLSPVDMTCQAINSTHYMCKVVENVQQSGGIPDIIAFPLALVFGLFLAGLIIFLNESGIQWGNYMCNDIEELTRKYKEFPDEANAEAWALQDACNLQAVARTFMCMARACNFKYDNPAVLITLDKMNSLCRMQGQLYDKEREAELSKAYNICMMAYKNHEELKKESQCSWMK